MFPSNSPLAWHQSLPRAHSPPDFPARCPHCLRECRCARTASQPRPPHGRSGLSCSCPSAAATLFAPSSLFRAPILDPPLHREVPAPSPPPHAPAPAKSPAPILALLPSPAPPGYSIQNADTPSLFLPPSFCCPSKACVARTQKIVAHGFERLRLFVTSVKTKSPPWFSKGA